MQIGTHGGAEREINVTPMIDVLLVLLVIFMLAQQFRRMVPVNVPPPATRAAGATPQIVLELRSDRSYAINGSVVDKTRLGERLAAAFADRPFKLLYVRTAAGWRYGEVIEAADIARGAGVQVLGYMPTRP
jgi:biopolymer transport protein TolR